MDEEPSQPAAPARTQTPLFDSVTITIASPEIIESRSSGEVTSGETIHKRNLTPVKDGLYCEKIFGPFMERGRLVQWEKTWDAQNAEAQDSYNAAAEAAAEDAPKPETSSPGSADAEAVNWEDIKREATDWECFCGGTKGIDNKGQTCKVCKTKVMAYQANRRRMGHIDLAVPVSHIWFLKQTPSPLALLLDMKVKDLEQVISFKRYLVIDPQSTPLKLHQTLSSTDYSQACETYGADAFIARLGAEAVRDVLAGIDLSRRIAGLQQVIAATRNKTKHKRLALRLELYQSMLRHKVRPEWMILTRLPVLPPGLRPPLPAPPNDDKLKRYLLGEKPRTQPPQITHVITPDVNDLYRRVINLNNRLKNMLQKRIAPELIVRNLTGLLQKSVDALFENGRGDLAYTARNQKRLLKPLGSLLGGKMGRFRQNLLGKRVDYSGRTVITVGPDLKLHQCGLPLTMAVTLFQPFVIRRLDELGLVKHRTSAKLWIKRQVAQTATTFFSRGDLVCFSSFVAKLKNPEDPVSVYLRSQLSREVLELAAQFPQKQVVRLALRYGLLLDLNRIVSGPLIYDDQRFMGVVLRPETRQLLNSELTSDARIRLNRLLLEDAYPLDLLRDLKPNLLWDLLAEVMGCRLVLLNRAPTLHRLSIQAFEPVLVEGTAIRLHPLVCTGYNADFDGDQMAVHVPLSTEAQMDARMLMMAANNILSPASGKPILTPTQDIVLGCYYLTVEPRQPKPPGLSKLPLLGSSRREVVYASDTGRLRIHDHIRLANPDFGKPTVFGNPQKKVIETTVGRVLFNEIWPAELGFLNQAIKKSGLEKMIKESCRIIGHNQTAAMLDKLKEIGFQAASRAGISIGIDDMLIPPIKEQAVDDAQKQTCQLKKQFSEGILTPSKYKEKLEEIWKACTNLVSEAATDELKINSGKDVHNPLWLMLESGARGTKNQVRQLLGLRGLIEKPGGGVDENPIVSNFREGLSVLEYFSSTHGARKGMCDTALKTADAGYLTRRLVEAAQNIIITEEDCGTVRGRWVQALRQQENVLVSLAERIVGRVAADLIPDPRDTQKTLVAANQEIDETAAEILTAAMVDKIKIRSGLDCACKQGICARCYGRDLATGNLIRLGAAVGIIAAQSIGEPGTQLTMRTFHTGGVASEKGDITGGLTDVATIFDAPHPKNPQVAYNDGVVKLIPIGKGKIQLVITNQFTRFRDQHLILDHEQLRVANDDVVTKGQQLTETKYDPYAEVEFPGFQESLISKVQAIYRQQDVTIHDKHIEIIVRQMLSKVRITEAGDTQFHQGQETDRVDFDEQNEWVTSKGGQPAEAVPILFGITQVAERAKSFLSAASFQNTTKILTKAATLSKTDPLLGMKERVMTGKLIPAGTGFKKQAPASG